MQLLRTKPEWKPNTDYLFANRNQFANRAFHQHGVGEIHQMYGERVLLLPHRDVENSGTGHSHERFLVGRPDNRVPQNLAVIGRKHFPESPVDVPREINDATVADFAQEYLRNIRFLNAGKNLCPRQIGIAGNERQGHWWKFFARLDLKT